jgi:hypothetical protein
MVLSADRANRPSNADTNRWCTVRCRHALTHRHSGAETSAEDAAFAACFDELGIPLEGDLEEFPARSHATSRTTTRSLRTPSVQDVFSFDLEGETIGAFALASTTGIDTVE